MYPLFISRKQLSINISAQVCCAVKSSVEIYYNYLRALQHVFYLLFIQVRCKLYILKHQLILTVKVLFLYKLELINNEG